MNKNNDPRDKRLLALAENADILVYNEDIESLKNLINKEKELLKSELTDFNRAYLFYLIATTYSDLDLLNKEFENEKNIEEQLYHFQKSVTTLYIVHKNNNTDIVPFIKGLKLQLYTNYANVLNKTGRITESIYYSKLAIEIDNNFAMALGNLGLTYFDYATLQFDLSYKEILNHFGYLYTTKALKMNKQLNEFSKNIYKNNIIKFDKKYLAYLKNLKLEFRNLYKEINEVEIKYRSWVLKECLFINPLNDLQLNESDIARDLMHLPNIVIEIKDNLGYKFHGLYNCIKQEFVSARYLLYEAIEIDNQTIHFSDKYTNIINTLDYSSYSIRIEKLKFSFRIFYSLFDKIAFFINYYYELGIKEFDVNFRSIWQSEKVKSNGNVIYKYKNTLDYSKNHALRGMYWINKQLYDEKLISTNPDAQKLDKLRHALEHKYVKIYNNIFATFNMDNLAKYISEYELITYTMELARTIRELIILLPLAIKISEDIKKETYQNEFIPQIDLNEFEDDWKI